MSQRSRIYYTESQKALMWERWQKGESLQQIAQLFDRNHSSVQRILAEAGGIRPAERCRSRLALTLVEREEISRAGSGPVDSFDCNASRKSAVDHQPGDQAQWRSGRLSCKRGRPGHLGSGKRDGWSQAFYVGDRYQGLLLRPTESLAAWIK